MSIYLDKIVALFALPLGWVLLAGVVALGLLAAQRRRAAGVVIKMSTLSWACARNSISANARRLPPSAVMIIMVSMTYQREPA